MDSVLLHIKVKLLPIHLWMIFTKNIHSISYIEFVVICLEDDYYKELTLNNFTDIYILSWNFYVSRQFRNKKSSLC